MVHMNAGRRIPRFWIGSASLLVLAASVGLGGCASRSVTRLDATSPVDISGYWNDTDSRLVAEEMIRDALSRPWIELFNRESGEAPVVLFDGIRNHTAEHIPQQTFLNTIQKELLNSGRVVFVANSVEREWLRDERADQTINASPQTRNRAQMERGADFLLGGEISYIEDAGNRSQLRVYQVDLRFLSLKDNTIAWAGQKTIRKVVGHARAKLF